MEKPSREQISADLVARGRALECRLGPEKAAQVRKLFSPLEIERFTIEELEPIQWPQSFDSE